SYSSPLWITTVRRTDLTSARRRPHTCVRARAPSSPPTSQEGTAVGRIDQDVGDLAYEVRRIKNDVQDLQHEIRELRQEMRAQREELLDELNELRGELSAAR